MMQRGFRIGIFANSSFTDVDILFSDRFFRFVLFLDGSLEFRERFSRDVTTTSFDVPVISELYKFKQSLLAFWLLK